MTPSSTLHDVHPASAGPRSVLARRIGTSLLALFVLAGAAGLLGDQQSTVTTRAQGYTVTLSHADWARAGQDVPFEIEVRNPAGLGSEITLAVTGSYFELYNTQGWFPEPSEQIRDGQWIYLTFDAPAGDTLRVSFDTFIQPNRTLGESGQLALVVDGERTTPIDVRTTLLP